MGSCNKLAKIKLFRCISADVWNNLSGSVIEAHSANSLF